MRDNGDIIGLVNVDFVMQQISNSLENAEGAFRVVLPNMHVRELSEEDEKYLPIFRLFEQYKEIKRSDVESSLGIGTTYAINILKELQDKELIIKIGNGKLTRYMLK